MTSHTFENHETSEGRRRSLPSSSPRGSCSYSLIASIGPAPLRSYPDLFDETASLGRELLLTALSRPGAKSEPLDRIEGLYNETVSMFRELVLTILGLHDLGGRA